jgi:hypothetical protein
MPYGSSAYGASPCGGSANAVNEQIFFPLGDNYAPDVLHERTALFHGPEEWYEILIRQGSENPSGPNGAEYKIYSARFPEDTPQLQVTIGGAGQTIIGAANIITVTALVDGAIWVSGLNFSIVGRPYDQNQ